MNVHLVAHFSDSSWDIQVRIKNGTWIFTYCH